MKKFAVITLAVVLVGAVSIGAFAYRGGMSNTMPQNQMYGQRGGMMYNAPQSQTYGPGMMPNTPQNQAYTPRRGMLDKNQQMPMHGGRRGMQSWRFSNPANPNAQTQPGQSPWAAQMITEEKATEAANEFVAKYFPEYTVKTVEKDDWRPMYFATIQGPNGVEQVMTIHGLGGQVMHVFPKIVEEPAAE